MFYGKPYEPQLQVQCPVKKTKEMSYDTVQIFLKILLLGSCPLASLSSAAGLQFRKIQLRPTAWKFITIMVLYTYHLAN